MKHVSAEMANAALRIAQANLPMDTGNLRYNATKVSYLSNSMRIFTGGAAADYMEVVEDRKHPFELQVFPAVKDYLRSRIKDQSIGSTLARAKNSYDRNIDRELDRREERLNASLTRFLEGE